MGKSLFLLLLHKLIVHYIDYWYVYIDVQAESCFYTLSMFELQL